jgi:hypothetical protein
MVVLSLLAVGCDSDEKYKLEKTTETPEAKLVRESMDPKCTYSKGPADTRPSKRNVGMVVQFGPAIYLVRDGKVYFGNDAAKKCSPKLQGTKDLTLQDLEG